MLPYLCGFWVHINVVLCNDSEKIFPGISGKYAIIIKFLTMETAILLHISRHLSYDMQMPRRNSFWIIFFALMVISFNPTYNYNGVSRFSRCLRFANEISLVCTILDSFLYENIISWETDRAAWLTLVGVGSAPSIRNEHKLKRENGVDSCWQLTKKLPWKVEQLLAVLLQGKTDLFLLICSLLDDLFSVNMLSCFYDQAFGV